MEFEPTFSTNENKLEIKDRNIFQFLAGIIFIVFGFLELRLVSNFDITNKSVYGGVFLLFLGLFVVFHLWKIRRTTFNKKTNIFTYHTWSIFKGGKA
jgi:succinate-acetate transporter protein